MTNQPDAARATGWSSFFRVGAGLLVPFVLVLTNVRLMLTPGLVSAEYATPGFPPDSYGFTPQERVDWAKRSLEYLLNDSGPEFLEGFHLADGSPLYNERELQHMVDVKRLVQKALAIWLASVAMMAVFLAGAWRTGGWPQARAGLRLGARITLIVMAILIALVLLAFPLLFEFGFHRVFFDSGTYLFSYSDSLIRLFPLRFWRDAFGLLLLLTLGEAGGLVFLTRERRPSLQ